MRRLREFTAGAVFFGATFVGCSAQDQYRIDETQPMQIVDTQYTPAHTESWSGPPCLVSIEGMCVMQTTYYNDVPDEWNITVQQCDNGPRKVAESKCAKKNIIINEEEFAVLAVGQIITKDGDRITKIPQ